MRAAIALGVVTVVVALAAALWAPIAVPRLVQLPTSFTTVVSASGTIEVLAAPGSLARLPSSTTLPVTIDLQVAAVSADGPNLVVSSTQTQKVGAAGGPTQDVVLQSQYVLDRRTTRNVDDPRAWSFTPQHRVNRAGTYSFAFGFDFSPTRTYPLWDDSIGSQYPLEMDRPFIDQTTPNTATLGVGGLKTTGLYGTTTQPADPAWIAALAPLQLPASLTTEQWKAAGFTLTSAAPVATNYLVTLKTGVSVDKVTGGTANLGTEVVTLSVHPDRGATNEIPAIPQTIFITTVSETPASVTTDTARLRTDGDQVRLATTTIPRALAGAAILSALLTIVMFLWARRRPKTKATAPAGAQTSAHH